MKKSVGKVKKKTSVLVIVAVISGALSLLLGFITELSLYFSAINLAEKLFYALLFFLFIAILSALLHKFSGK